MMNHPLRCFVIAVVATTAFLTNTPSAEASFSADFNGDAVVDGSDFAIWNSNKYTTGASFSDGDANGDGYVGILGDINVWLCQTSIATPSTASASASYNPTTGNVTLNFAPGPALSAIYLVNTDSTSFITSPAISGAGSDIINNPVAFPVGSQSVSHFGTIFPGSSTVSVAPFTSVNDLKFYYQNQGAPMIPMAITDTSTSTTVLPDIPSALCNCPEPSGMSMVLLFAGGLGAFVNRFRVA